METSVNNKCRAFTSLEQSKKLAEILPIESADLKWFFWEEESNAAKTPSFGYRKTVAESYKDTGAVYLPCWSLAALLEQLKTKIQLENKQILFLYINKYNDVNYDIRYTNSWSGEVLIAEADNLVDACYEMIIKLHELNLL